MITIDKRFEYQTINLLKGFINKQCISLRCDPFYFSTSVYGLVGININNKWLSITNFIEVLDYYGEKDDVAVFKINETEEQNIKSLTGENMIDIPINEKIVSIDIINENQRLYKNSLQIYDVWFTRGIIFILENGNEISLEKDVWFSEDIIVERGKKLLEKFSSTNRFTENFDDEYIGECSRKIIKIQ
jgi:hypothetical protein